jgi:hypothetical protein
MLFKLFSLLFGIQCSAISAASLEPCDSWFTFTAAPRGVVIVSHGMNLKPTRMDELAKVLASDGYEVLRPAFSGHCGKNEKYLSVTAKDWENDARRIYALASIRAKALNKPLYLVAYSFTAVIFQSMSQELPFERKVYLAPALAMKFWYPAVRFFAGLFPDFEFSSLNLPTYAANGRSNARGFLALDHFFQKWERRSEGSDSAAALLFAAPGDELISYKGLEVVASLKSGWTLEQVSSGASTLPKKFHHLIIDSSSLGMVEWERVTGKMLNFLAGQD